MSRFLFSEFQWQMRKFIQPIRLQPLDKDLFDQK